MADDIIEFAKCKKEEKLRNLVSSIELVAEQAHKDNHKFLAYLLEMAHIEAQSLLGKEET